MMPVIRISDATFVDLKSVAIWLETKTPSDTIEKLVQAKMAELDLERDVEPVSQTGQELRFEKTPGLSFTRILTASVGSVTLERANWAGLLHRLVSVVKATGLSAEQLANELQVPAKAMKFEGDGYKYVPSLGISIQGQSAPDAWKEVTRLADKFGIPVEVRFQWRDNPKAQHPGEIGLLRAGV